MANWLEILLSRQQNPVLIFALAVVHFEAIISQHGLKGRDLLLLRLCLSISKNHILWSFYPGQIQVDILVFVFSSLCTVINLR